MAQDIVKHFLGRGFVGKAMVVSIDKATALRMHDKVRKHWATETKRVQKELGRLALLPGESVEIRQNVAELKPRIKKLESEKHGAKSSAGKAKAANARLKEEVKVIRGDKTLAKAPKVESQAKH